MDTQKLQAFVKGIQDAFLTPDAVKDWIVLRVPLSNPYNMLVGGTFEAKVVSLVTWGESHGRDMELFQLLADYPPPGATFLPGLVYYVTDQVVKPQGGIRGPGYDNWFVTERPFANRDNLRTAMAGLDVAPAGPKCILVVDGAKQSGKSHGLRLAVRYATAGGVVPVDVVEWGTNQMYAWDLAGALFPAGAAELIARNYDPTKESAAVPQLITWLKAKLLNAPKTWIVLDHCNRPNLTESAADLLGKFVSLVESGWLGNVRLLIADADLTKLPKLKGRSAWDTAALPDRAAVKKWCTELADHLHKAGALKQPCTDAEIELQLDGVFEGVGTTLTLEDFAKELEKRLGDVFEWMRGH
ncbi:MAG TPA: hypothetical protein VIQ98_09930 [Gemmatimonadales bacterium]|jgi:hypothetical protein